MNSLKTAGCESNPLPWYSIRTRSNHERTAAYLLSSRGYEQYLPSYKVRRRWSDRVVETSKPLFPGYVVCRSDARVRVPILSTPGVVSIVGFGKEPAVIDAAEIDVIHRVLRSGVSAEPCAFLQEGQRVTIVKGPMEGLEGILLKKKSDWRPVVSVSILQRSVSIEVDRTTIESL